MRKLENEIVNHMIQRNGDIRHTVIYSMTQEDWPKIKRIFLDQLL